LPVVITATETVRQTTLSGIIILLDFGQVFHHHIFFL